jgi:hypothetical protein
LSSGKLTVVEESDWSAGSAWKHISSWMLSLPPVEPAKPKRSWVGNEPFEVVIDWFVSTWVSEPPP